MYLRDSIFTNAGRQKTSLYFSIDALCFTILCVYRIRCTPSLSLSLSLRVAEAQDHMAADAMVRLANKEVVLVSRPCGLPKLSDFAVVQSEFAFSRPPPPQSLVLKVLWISIDPYLRELLHQQSPIAGIPVYEIGKPLYMVQSLSKVLASGCPNFTEGDIVYGVTSVSEYAMCDDAALKFQKVNPDVPHIPLTHYLGVLGVPGHTSWVGINIVTQLRPKEGIFISCASGAVGLLVGQLAKLKGCHVVGCASSEKKVKLLKEKYNFDDAFNYKEEDLELALKRCFPNGLDVYFENVGGKMLEATLEVINPNGRIIACGMISQYNKEGNERDGVKNLFNIIGKSLKMEGFLITNFAHTWDAFHKEVIPLLQQGKISYTSDVLGRGMEEFPKALIRMLTGQNLGKALLFVNDE